MEDNQSNVDQFMMILDISDRAIAQSYIQMSNNNLEVTF